jgi:uncharacterized membrane protein
MIPDIPDTRSMLIIVFIIGAILLWLGTVGGGFFLGVFLFVVILYALFVIARAIDRRLVHGKRRGGN